MKACVQKRDRISLVGLISCLSITGLASSPPADAGAWPSPEARPSRAIAPAPDLGFQRLEKSTALDPQGDTFASEGAAIDLVSFSGRIAGERVIFRLGFAEPVEPVGSDAANAMGGYIDIDTDRDGTTGDVPWTDFLSGSSTSGLGNEAYVDLFSYDPADGSVDLVNDLDESVLGRAPVIVEPTALTITIPIAWLGEIATTGFQSAVVVGTLAEATDLAPNQGSMHVPFGPDTSCETVARVADRFDVGLQWSTADSGPQPGCVSILRTDDTAIFYFFETQNLELMLKVLDGCGFNNHYWVYYAGLTDVEMTITVTDSQTGTVRSYSNELGNAADAVTDTTAFATCP